MAVIYNEGILDDMATFERAERTAEDVLVWLGADDASINPILVAVGADNELIGWIRAMQYRPRDCYRSIREFSVYVARSARGRRVGDALMTAFIPECAQVGVTKIVARIFPENAASRALCARHGFREVGTYEKHGTTGGRWRDVVIVERLVRENMRQE